MAEGKKGFVLYADQKELFDKLPNEKAGELIKHIFKYVNDEDPETDDLLIDLAFIPIRQQLKRDLVKWEHSANNSRENGKLGGRPKKPKEPSGLNDNPGEPKEPVIVNVKVNDTVNVKVKDKDNATLIKDVCDFFSVNEMKNFNAFKMLNAFVSVSGIDAKTFNAYKEYKHTTGDKIHGWQSFIGSREKGFEDGAWCSCDWASKIKDIPQQSNGIPSEPDLNWIATKGKDIQLYQKACKIWRENGFENVQPEGSTKRIWREIKQ